MCPRVYGQHVCVGVLSGAGAHTCVDVGVGRVAEVNTNSQMPRFGQCEHDFAFRLCNSSREQH